MSIEENLDQYYKGIVDPFEVNGIVFCGATSCSRRRVSELIPNLVTRPNDVLLAGYPKCGNHWMKYILALMHSEDDFDKVNQSFIGEQVEFLEVVSPRNGESDDEAFARWEASTKPRLWNTHLPWNMLPSSVHEGKCKIILMLRNPKDLVVSYYNFHKSFVLLGCYQGTFTDFLDVFFSDKGLVFGNYFDLYKSYLKHQSNENMLIVHFEDLLKDLRGQIKRLADFLGRNLTGDQIDKISKMTSFVEMKKSGAMALWENMPEQYLNRQVSPFMRKGVKGDWKTVFTVADNERFDKEYKSKLADINIETRH